MFSSPPPDPIFPIFYTVYAIIILTWYGKGLATFVHGADKVMEYPTCVHLCVRPCRCLRARVRAHMVSLMRSHSQPQPQPQSRSRLHSLTCTRKHTLSLTLTPTTTTTPHPHPHPHPNKRSHSHSHPHQHHTHTTRAPRLAMGVGSTATGPCTTQALLRGQWSVCSAWCWGRAAYCFKADSWGKYFLCHISRQPLRGNTYGIFAV